VVERAQVPSPSVPQRLQRGASTAGEESTEFETESEVVLSPREGAPPSKSVSFLRANKASPLLRSGVYGAPALHFTPLWTHRRLRARLLS
jgi:hypothetical protein